MRFDESYSGNVFIKSFPNYEESQVVLYGMPMDWTVSFRLGPVLALPEFARFRLA